jgi:WD40 repeat protein
MDNNLTELRRIVLSNDKIDSALPIPRSLEIKNNNTILLGTLGSEIFELEFDGSFLGENFKANNILASHFSTSNAEINDINGITFWPSKELFLSVSDDCTLRFWDMSTNKHMDYMKLDLDNDGNKIRVDQGNPNKATCITINSSETAIAIGFIDGSFRVYLNLYRFIIPAI